MEASSTTVGETVSWLSEKSGGDCDLDGSGNESEEVGGIGEGSN